MLVRDVNSALREHPQYSRLIPYVNDFFVLSSISNRRNDLTADLAKAYKKTGNPIYESEESLISSEWNDNILEDLMTAASQQRKKIHKKVFNFIATAGINLFWCLYFKHPISSQDMDMAVTLHSLIMLLKERKG